MRLEDIIGKTIKQISIHQHFEKDAVTILFTDGTVIDFFPGDFKIISPPVSQHIDS